VNRPTRITLIGIVIVLLWALLLGATGRAQENSKTAQLLNLYKECVLDAVRSQVKNSVSAINPSAATEVAFQACRTEEQALFAHASAGGVSQTQANEVITDYKLKIKQQVRKVFADAEKNAVQRAVRSAPTIDDQPPPRPGCRGAYRRYDGEWVYRCLHRGSSDTRQNCPREI